MAQCGAGTLEKAPLAKNHNQETGGWPISGCSQQLAQNVTAWAHVWTVSKLGAALPAQEPVPHASENHALIFFLKVLTPQNNQTLAWHVVFMKECGFVILLYWYECQWAIASVANFKPDLAFAIGGDAHSPGVRQPWVPYPSHMEPVFFGRPLSSIWRAVFFGGDLLRVALVIHDFVLRRGLTGGYTSSLLSEEVSSFARKCLKHRRAPKAGESRPGS